MFTIHGLASRRQRFSILLIYTFRFGGSCMGGVGNQWMYFRSGFIQCVNYMRFNEKSLCFRWQEDTRTHANPKPGILILKRLTWYYFTIWDIYGKYFINKNNTERHTTHTIVSWPNPKQWVHTSDLMMIIRQSMYIISIITKERVN